MPRNEAYHCLIKLLSTYKSNEDEYVKYATECGPHRHCE